MSRTMAMLLRGDNALIAMPNGTVDRHPIQPWWTMFDLARELPFDKLPQSVTHISLVYTTPGVNVATTPNRHFKATTLQSATGLTVELVSAHQALTTYHHKRHNTSDERLGTVMIGDYPIGGGRIDYWTHDGQESGTNFGRTPYGDDTPLSRYGRVLGQQIASWLCKHPSLHALVCITSGPIPGAITLDNPEFSEQLHKTLGVNWTQHLTIYPSPQEVLQGALLVAAE